MLCIAIVKDIGIGFVIWLPVKVGYMNKYRYMQWRTEGGQRGRVAPGGTFFRGGIFEMF